MNQLQTGKKITKLSDDPLVAVKGIGYRTEVTRIEQYQRNLNEVENWFDNTDSALDKATSAMQRIRELAIQANNGTNSDNELTSIKAEVEQLRSHLKDIVNTNVNDKYIFNGTNTGQAPFGTGQIYPEFTNDDVEIAISDETVVKANLRGEVVFGDGNDGVFGVIDNFLKALNLENEEIADEDTLGTLDVDNEETKDISSSISQLDASINKIINARADLGARMNRLELVQNRLSEQEILATKSLSDNEDVDYAEAITNLITQESIHRAALSAGSRIIQPSLLDFLR